MQIKTFAVVALASSVAVAMPAPIEKAALAVRQWRGRWGERPPTNNGAVTTVEVVTTVVGYAPQAAAPTASVAVQAAAASPSSAPSSAPVAASSGSSSGSDTGYMAIVNKYRTAGGLPAFTQSSQLEANAMKTSTDSVGGLKHELNPGTMGQVMAPGNAGNFESVYVGGWLCEIPTLPGLNGICATMAQGWNHAGQTGHAEILTGSYKSIGCAFAASTGVWTCDVA